MEPLDDAIHTELIKLTTKAGKDCVEQAISNK
jgi:hypothetical protein